jgi:hypothetical protein
MSERPDDRAVEAARQPRLIAALFSKRADASALPVRESGACALRGLQAYRATARASAERALAAAFPTVHQLLGDEDFAHLASEFRLADPPLRGDLGEWGGALPAWLEGHAELHEWPYLGDCARLDWAVHLCERAEDPVLDAASMARLGDTDPSRLVLRLAPGVSIIESRWPIGLIFDAHRSSDDAAFDAVRLAIAESRGQTLLVSREAWRAVPQVIDAATARWTRQLLAGDDLATALAHAGEHFDFAGWLTTALRSAWLKGVEVLADQGLSFMENH